MAFTDIFNGRGALKNYNIYIIFQVLLNFKIPFIIYIIRIVKKIQARRVLTPKPPPSPLERH